MTQINIAQLTPDMNQPRTNFEYADLAKAMKAGHNILNEKPIVCYKIGKDDNDRIAYRIKGGHRRYYAAMEAELDKVPCIVVDAASDHEILADQLMEDQHKAHFLPSERVRAYSRFLNGEEGVYEERLLKLVEMTGKTSDAIKSDLALANLPDSILEAVDSGALYISVAKKLATDFNADEYEGAYEAAKKKTSVKTMNAALDAYREFIDAPTNPEGEEDEEVFTEGQVIAKKFFNQLRNKVKKLENSMGEKFSPTDIMVANFGKDDGLTEVGEVIKAMTKMASTLDKARVEYLATQEIKNQ